MAGRYPEFPGFGAVVNKEFASQPDLPTFVAIPNSPQQAGFLGIEYSALETNASPQPGRPFEVRGISVGGRLTPAAVEKRHQLLADLDTRFGNLKQENAVIAGLDEFSARAFEIVRSPRARQAFDVSREPRSVIDQFGAHGFGQSCLLACRLIEAGVRFVTINLSGWDTHSDNFSTLKQTMLGLLDDVLSALLATLAARSLLESTAVLATGEFGRTPKINERAGRDHWPRAMCVLMAGAGIRVGQVIGASDAQATEPADRAITPEEVAASFYHSLGIDYEKEYQTPTGRPIMLVRSGNLIPGLF